MPHLLSSVIGAWTLGLLHARQALLPTELDFMQVTGLWLSVSSCKASLFPFPTIHHGSSSNTDPSVWPGAMGLYFRFPHTTQSWGIDYIPASPQLSTLVQQISWANCIQHWHFTQTLFYNPPMPSSVLLFSFFTFHFGLPCFSFLSLNLPQTAQWPQMKLYLGYRP